MKKIKWCVEQKNGIELIEPNTNLSKAYVLKAENSLKAVAALKNNPEWEISSAYYTMYFSLYAILMKIGIKCEIHSCTISFMANFLNDYFSKEDIELIQKSQKARIDLQYYSDRVISDELYDLIIRNTAKFLTTSKEVLYQISEKTVQNIREELAQ